VKLALAAGAIGSVAVAAWLVARPPAAATAPVAAPPAVSLAGPRVVAPPSSAPSPAALGSSAPVEVRAPEPPPMRARSASPPRATAEPAAAPSASASAATSAADRLRDEAEGVRRTRALLRDKDPSAALAELDRLGRLFPAGPLEEEREVLAIEALAASGDAPAAKKRARRFLFERPTSVHAEWVRAFAK
jgi:hypothetical protein